MNKGWLDSILKLARMSPAELAHEASLDEGLISRLRKTDQVPTLPTLLAIKKATNVPLTTILEEMGYLDESSADDRANKQIIEILNQMPAEEKEKEIRRIELNMELATNGKSKRNTRTRTHQSSA